MADYRRLISYIYEYEGKKKGKNVGFAIIKNTPSALMYMRKECFS